MKLILGRINATNTQGYWKCNDLDPTPYLGQYALVQNKNSYDLVQVMAIVETTPQLQYSLINNKSRVTKDVITFIVPQHYISPDEPEVI